MTDHFRLPAAWRTGSGEVPHEHRREVGYGDLAPALDALARAVGTTRRSVLTAAHVKVLSMLTEEHEFRTDVRWPAHDGTVHSIHVDVTAVGSWRDLLAVVREGARTATPLPGTGDEPPHRPDRALFTVGAPAPDATAGTAPGTRGSTVDGPAGYHGLRADADDDTLTLGAASSVVDGEQLERIASMYRSVLESLAEGPDGDAVTARMPADERKAVLARWGVGPHADRPADTVVGLFRSQAARTPDAPAVTVAGSSLSYRELDERSNQLAHHLRGLGVRPEALVGVCLRRTADLLPTLLGIWKAGAAYLPLDPDLPAPRLRRMLSTAGCPLVVTRTGLADLDAGGYVRWDEDREAIAGQPRTPVEVPVRPGQLAYVIYTSGSTGTPKGVLVEHGGLLNYLLWTAGEYAARGSGGSPFFTSIGFDLGMPSLFTPLLVGQRVDLLPDPLDRADLGALLVAGAPYSFVKMTPGHLNLLSLDLDPDQARGLAGLVIAAGDAFTVELARRWADLAGPDGTPVATEYGPTEITVGNSGQQVTDLHRAGLVPLGDPIPNTTMYVLTDRLEPVPVGVPGEVHVGGAGVSRGYLHDPALTAERFVPDPYGPAGSRLYRTGDRARWLWSGCLEFLGRVDHQVKIRGHRVEPGEIRETLRRHPDVDDAVVVAYGSPAAAARLVAFVLPVPGRVPDTAGLRAGLAAELPGHMVPARIVPVHDIPLTANGKVDTRALEGLL